MAWTYYSYRNLDARADSDADYRIVGKWWSDRLQDLGWAKTADTGQIDWSTATRPGSPTANTKGGYEIRKSTLTSADIYAKISYGMGYNTSCIGLWLQCGDGSDGAGVLTGDVTTEVQAGSAIGVTSPYESSMFVAGDAYNFLLGGTDPAVLDGFVAGVQRTCDENGADTSTGYYAFRAGYAATNISACQYVSFASGAAAQDSNSGFGTLYLPRALVSTASVLVAPLYAQNGLTWAPMRDIVTLENAGGLLVEFDAPMYGTTKRYKVIWFGATAGVLGVTTAASRGLGVRVS